MSEEAIVHENKNYRVVLVPMIERIADKDGDVQNYVVVHKVHGTVCGHSSALPAAVAMAENFSDFLVSVENSSLEKELEDMFPEGGGSGGVH